MKKNKVTIYKVAATAGVSLATVSRVLNYPEKVKPETREKVLKVIKELGYRPNVIARGLASRKSTFVGIVVPDFSRGSVAEAINGIVKLAIKYEYQTLVFPAEDDNRNKRDVWSDIIASQVDGILYLNDLHDEDAIEGIDRINIPVVALNSVFKESKIATVNIDYSDACYKITKKLIDNGRKNIVLATTERKYTINDVIKEGYLKAIQEANLKSKIVYTSGKTDKNTKIFIDYLDNNKIDGIIGVRDSITISFLNNAIISGYNVPNDLEVYSCKDTRICKLARPQLSSIHVPTYELGKIAMEKLTVLMEDGKLEKMDLFVPYKIIERETTK